MFYWNHETFESKTFRSKLEKKFDKKILNPTLFIFSFGET